MTGYEGFVISNEFGVRYRLLRLVGQGGEAAVYEAIAPQLGGLRVAIKVFEPSRRDELHQMMIRKSKERLFKGLKPSDHLVRLLSIEPGGPPHPEDDSRSSKQDWTYLVMEWVPGRPLNAFFTPQGLDDLSPLATAAQGLAVLHEKLVHGDVKPSNILVDTKDVGRVVDLGAALTLGADPSERRVASPPYTSPRIGVEPAAPSHDAYSLGMVALHCTVGVRTPLDDVEAALATTEQRYGATVAQVVGRALRHELRDGESIATMFAPLAGARRREDRSASSNPGPTTQPRPGPDDGPSAGASTEHAGGTTTPSGGGSAGGGSRSSGGRGGTGGGTRSGPRAAGPPDPNDHTDLISTTGRPVGDYRTLIPAGLPSVAAVRFRFLIYLADPANWIVNVMLAVLLGVIAGTGVAAVALL